MILSRENTGQVNIDQLIDAKVKSGNPEELLLIVPTNRKARSVKKEFISSNPNGAASGLNIETLGTLSGKLLSEIMSFKKLSEAAATVFIKQSAHELKLKYFSIYKDEIPFGTLDKVKNVISEYKRHGITPELLRREAEKLEKSEKNKALDIADIYELFLKKCAALSAFELGDIYRELNRADEAKFIGVFKKLYPVVDLVLFNGFSEFSDPEIDIIKKVSLTLDTKTFISFDYYEGNEQLFGHLEQCYKKLERAGFKKVKDKSTSVINEFDSVVQRNLFNSRSVKLKFDFPCMLFKIEGSDREREIEFIAKEIKRLIIKDKVEPHRISVVFNLIQNYSSVLKDVFEKNGIPFNLTDRTPLDNSNPVTALINFLEIAENNFFYKNIFRALSSKFIDAAGIDLANLYRVSSELNIVAGKQNWINILEDSISNIKHTADNEGNLSSKKEDLLTALSDIKKIAAFLKPFEEKLAITEFVKRLESLIVDLKVPYRLLEITIDQERNVRAFTEFIETVTEVFSLLEEEAGNEKKFPLSYFMDQLRTACGWARFNEKEKSNYGVQVTNLEEIRGLRFDYVFIGGLCDGDLPTRYNPEIFFSGSFKKKAIVHQLEERYMFYQSLCAWNERLYISYHKTEDGKEKVASTFLKDLEHVFNFSEKSEKDYIGQIFSEEEYQIFLGKQQNEFASSTSNSNLNIDLQKISNSLRIEKLRESNSFADSPFTGKVLAHNDEGSDQKYHDEAAQKLAAYASKQYSISQLETYAKCPFKFFVERVLGIETVEEPTEDIEAIEMGRLLHSILYEFYSTMRERGLRLVGCDAQTFAEAENLIFKIAEEQIQTTAFKSPLTFYEKEKILGLNSNREESILYRFLEVEQKCDDDFLPMFFEVSFGLLKESEPVSLARLAPTSRLQLAEVGASSERADGSDKILSDPMPVEIDGIHLRGKIDRIELNEKLKSFNIVDYKLSGAKPTFDELKNGISLQLPVYLFAAGELLSKKFNNRYTPNEMFIYSLKYAVDDFGRDKVALRKRKDEEIQSIDQLIAKTIEHIKLYVKQISLGEFGLSPHEDREKIVCRYCQFRTICRIDEI